MLEFTIKVNSHLAEELADALVVNSLDTRLIAAGQALKDKLHRDALAAQVVDEAYLAHELVEGEHIHLDVAIPLAAEYGEDVWNDVLTTAWAFTHHCLANEGDVLSTRILIKLVLMSFGGSPENWSDVCWAVHKLNEYHI